jgi:methyltransferase family protein
MFYDRAARHLANYSREQLAELRAVVDDPNPEAIFTDLVTQGVRSEDQVLDIGTGDGYWLMQYVGPRVRLAIGLDNGEVRLGQGLRAKADNRAENVQFMLADARQIPLADQSVSVIANRRGPFGDPSDPRYFAEGFRVLEVGGRAFEIGIGELNAREVSQVFGRGQMLEEEGRGPIIERIAATRREKGFQIDRLIDMPTFEYFPNREALELRLLTAPIFEEFDPQSEAHLVDEVVRRYSTERGIRLTFHRTLLVSTKMRP